MESWKSQNCKNPINCRAKPSWSSWLLNKKQNKKKWKYAVISKFIRPAVIKMTKRCFILKEQV